MDVNYDEIKEQQPVAEGEYTLVISDVREKLDNDTQDLKGLLVICEIEGNDEAANVLHNLSFPLQSDDLEKIKNKMLFMKRFLTHFSIPFNNGIDLDTFVGKRAKCNLVLEDYQGTISNKIKLPNIK
jgi:hypothetical protein